MIKPGAGVFTRLSAVAYPSDARHVDCQGLVHTDEHLRNLVALEISALWR